MSSRCLKLLEKCKNTKQLKQSHAQIITTGLSSNNFALSRLLSFSSDPHFKYLHHGFKLFNQIQKPTICIYNTMIKSCLFHGKFANAFQIYKEMMKQGMFPDNYTLPYVLKACVSMECCFLGESLHGCCLKSGFTGDVFVGNTLIGMYSAFGDMKGALCVFEEMILRNEASYTVLISGFAKLGDVDNARLFFDLALVKDRKIWGSMISAYVQNNCFNEGLYMFRLMQENGIKPDEAIFASVLCACAQLGALDIGIWIHRYLDRYNFPLGIRLGTSLIDMYAKCGHLSLARKIFDRLTHKDIVCWNVMISAMAMHGDGEGAIRLFSEMEKSGVRPDDVTFIAIFNACSYSNMHEHGLIMLNKMITIYGIEPKSEHYGCIIDFLSRAGFLEDTKRIVEKMLNFTNPSEEAVAWRSIMSACCDYEQSGLAKIVAEKLLILENHSGAYVLLSNLYAGLGKHEDAKRIRTMMRNRGVEKIPGCSAVEINGAVHEFIAGEKTHSSISDIHNILKKINTHGFFSVI